MQLASRRSRLEGRVLWPVSAGLAGCKNAGTMTDSHQRDRTCGTGHFRLTNALTGCQGPRSEPPCTHVPRRLLPKGYVWLQGRASAISLPSFCQMLTHMKLQGPPGHPQTCSVVLPGPCRTSLGWGIHTSQEVTPDSQLMWDSSSALPCPVSPALLGP